MKQPLRTLSINVPCAADRHAERDRYGGLWGPEDDARDAEYMARLTESCKRERVAREQRSCAKGCGRRIDPRRRKNKSGVCRPCIIANKVGAFSSKLCKGACGGRASWSSKSGLCLACWSDARWIAVRIPLTGVSTPHR